MVKATYNIWVKYRMGLINIEELNSDMQKEMKNIDSTLNILVPDEEFIDVCRKIGKLDSIINDEEKINRLIIYFSVSKEIIVCKLRGLIEEQKNKEEKLNIEKFKKF